MPPQQGDRLLDFFNISFGIWAHGNLVGRADIGCAKTFVKAVQ
jgi:hypothetical protein